MEFLYFLQSIRNPVFDFFFDLVTKLGEETVFLAVAIFFFWCVSMREGLYILITGLFGTVINQGLKMMCRIERPWIIDPDFPIVESARLEATGYSFPSGHTQNIAGTFGSIGRYSSRKWVRILCVAVIVLVAFSRNYLGVHTPIDVVVSLLIAGALVFGLYPFFKSEERFNKSMPIIVAVSAAVSLALLIYVNVLPATLEGVDAVTAESYLVNLESAKENASTLFGCMLGLVAVYPVDRLFIKFDTKAKWYAQVIKLAVGLGIILLIKSVLQSPLESLFGIFTDTPMYIARAARYFLIVVFAGIVWPLTFRFFGKMELPFMERFTEFVKSKLGKNRHASVSADNSDN